ncbi:hypothetical protein [Siminovitchia terrae]|nr:hypothetical protein [Siminovitchia terrae]
MPQIFEEIYRAELDKTWAQIRQGAFDRFISICELFYSFNCRGVNSRNRS